jgi:hypothetical protein
VTRPRGPVVLSSLEERSRVRDPELPQLGATSSPSRSSGSVFLDGGQATFCQAACASSPLDDFSGLRRVLGGGAFKRGG